MNRLNFLVLKGKILYS